MCSASCEVAQAVSANSLPRPLHISVQCDPRCRVVELDMKIFLNIGSLVARASLLAKELGP
jgi:hypothetical protein